MTGTQQEHFEDMPDEPTPTTEHIMGCLRGIPDAFEHRPTLKQIVLNAADRLQTLTEENELLTKRVKAREEAMRVREKVAELWELRTRDAIKALKRYANKDKWLGGNSLYFTEFYCPSEDGWELAQQALKAIENGNEK